MKIMGFWYGWNVITSDDVAGRMKEIADRYEALLMERSAQVKMLMWYLVELMEQVRISDFEIPEMTEERSAELDKLQLWATPMEGKVLVRLEEIGVEIDPSKLKTSES